MNIKTMYGLGDTFEVSWAPFQSVKPERIKVKVDRISIYSKDNELQVDYFVKRVGQAHYFTINEKSIQ